VGNNGNLGNYRQNGAMWSMQVNVNAGGAQIDIDQWNPNWGLVPLGGHLYNVAQHHFGKTDTNQTSVANALSNRNVGVTKGCTGGQ
jgi:hypothetical protein